jgi:hypothetical protein
MKQQDFGQVAAQVFGRRAEHLGHLTAFRR